MYYEYWGMNRHPFDNVPDPTMYFSAHESVETAVAEVLFAIEEGDEVLAVIVGEVGLGKTTSLRVILDSLEQEKYRIAFVTNPDVSFTMLLREMIGQLRGQPCPLRHKDDLLEEFNKILFETADEGKRVLIFIDEGNAFKAVNLESLRLLTNMQEDDRNLFTIVLAGQPKLARMLEAPSRANLFQRIGVYCRLTRMESWQMVRDYVDHRMERAGASRQIFTDEAVQAVYRYSEMGVPRLINKICKLSLKAGQTNDCGEVTGEIVSSIGERFLRTTRAAETSQGGEAQAAPESNPPAGAPKKTRKPKAAKSASPRPAETPGDDNSEAGGPVEEVDSLITVASGAESATHADLPDSPVRLVAEAHGGTIDGETRVGFYGVTSYNLKKQQLDFTDKASFYPGDDEPKPPRAEPEAAEEIRVSPVQLCMEDLMRSGAIDKGRGAGKMERMKMAGQLAAEEIKKHPEVAGLAEDPVVMWKELRNEILTAFTADVHA